MGREIIPTILEHHHLVAKDLELLYANMNTDTTFGFFFWDTNTYIPPEYDEIRMPGEDPFVMVRKGNTWGWVDRRGKVVIPIHFDAVTPFDATGRAWVLQYGLQFYINRKGEMVWE